MAYCLYASVERRSAPHQRSFGKSRVSHRLDVESQLFQSSKKYTNSRCFIYTCCCEKPKCCFNALPSPQVAAIEDRSFPLLQETMRLPFISRLRACTLVKIVTILLRDGHFSTYNNLVKHLTMKLFYRAAQVIEHIYQRFARVVLCRKDHIRHRVKGRHVYVFLESYGFWSWSGIDTDIPINCFYAKPFSV